MHQLICCAVILFAWPDAF